MARSERKGSRPLSVLVSLAVGLIGGLLGASAVLGLTALPSSEESTPSPGSGSACGVEQTLASVVVIEVRGPEGEGTGSEVVKPTLPGGCARAEGVGSDSFIITNEHVVGPAGSEGEVVVTYADGVAAPGKVVGSDDLTDLAVVRTDDLSDHTTPVDVGDSSTLRVGQQVVALGAPLGLSSTVTTGIVSATDRDVRVPSADGFTYYLVGAVQIDAAINPGNSGGALVDCSGKLVGINSAGASPPGDKGSVGLNFAIPATLFAPLATELVTSGRVRHPTLGMQVAEISSAIAQRNGVSAGLFVQAVTEQGPAQLAEISPGDIVVEIQGEPVRTPDDLTQRELTLEDGETVEVTIERDGQRSTVSVVVRSAG